MASAGRRWRRYQSQQDQSCVPLVDNPSFPERDSVGGAAGKQAPEPGNHPPVLNAALNLTRGRTELMVENALLRQ